MSRNVPGEWKLALIDIDRASEFTGDDVDQFSKIVDLGGYFSHVQVHLPALTSGVVSVYACKGKNLEDAQAESPKQVQAFDGNATGHFAHATTATEGDIWITFFVGAIQFLRIKAAGNQAADRSIYVQGC
jgi:hypothetical protein